jgi:hypothetical protein
MGIRGNRDIRDSSSTPKLIPTRAIIIKIIHIRIISTTTSVIARITTIITHIVMMEHIITMAITGTITHITIATIIITMIIMKITTTLPMYMAILDVMIATMTNMVTL